MRFADMDRLLHNKKATRVTTGVNEPSRREGSDGDITIRNIKGKGIFLFVKYNNNWYSRVLFDGPAEIGMSNPGRTMQLFGWNPDSKAYQLIDSSEVLSIEFGSPGKLTMGSKKASSTGGGTGNKGQLIIGDDSKSLGLLMLGKGSVGHSTIASGMIDDVSDNGYLNLWGGSIIPTTVSSDALTVLRVGSAPTIHAMMLKYSSLTAPRGAVLCLYETENFASDTELITDSQDRDIATDSAWIVHNPDSTGMTYTEDFTTDDRLEITPTEDNNSEEGAQLPTSAFTTIVSGTTYRVSAKVYVAAGTLGGSTAGGGIGQFYFRLGGVESSPFTLTTTSVISYDIFVTSDAALQIYGKVDTTTQWFIDDISIKKVAPVDGSSSGSLYIERQSASGDGVLKFRNSDGDISTLSSTTGGLSGSLPLAGGTMTGDIVHAGTLTLDTNVLALDAATTTTGNGILFKANGTTFIGFEVHHGSSYFVIHSQGDIATGDKFQFIVREHGATTFQTADADGSDADILFDIDGDITLDSATGSITCLDNGSTYTPSAGADIANKTYVDTMLPLAGGTITASNFGATAVLTIDANQPATVEAEDSVGLHIDYDRTVAALGTNVHNDIGINLDVNSDSLGASSVVGMDIDVVSGNSATSNNQTAIGLDISCTGADANAGINVTTSGTHLKLMHNTDTDDYCTISVAAAGVTTIATNDADGTVGNLVLDADGAITLDSASGVFIMKKGTTEFSVANSAYAGMILGYVVEGINQTPATYTLTTSEALVASGTHHVSFIAPPSGVVEIEVQVNYDAGTGSAILSLGLSDNTTIGSNGLDVWLLQQIGEPARAVNDPNIIHKWVVTGLTAGTSYKWYLTAKSSTTSGTPKIQWGGDSTGENPVFIMKATALPTAVTNYAVYG